MIEKISLFVEENAVNIAIGFAGFIFYHLTLRPSVQRFLSKKTMTLWHPDSPGMRVVVKRGPFARMFYPSEFATLSEAIKAKRQGKVIRENKPSTIPDDWQHLR